MPINAQNKSGGDFQIAPQGQFAAICFEVIDLGSQFNKMYGNSSPKVLLRFELHGENQLGDGSGYMLDSNQQPDPKKPFIIMEKHTLSLGEKANLRRFLQGWRGKPFTEEEAECFDVGKLLGAPAMVTIQHNKSKDGQKTFANISNITPLLKSLPKPVPVNPLVKFEMTPWDERTFQALPDWIKKMVEESPEYKAIKAHTNLPKAESVDDMLPHAAYMDDIPF